MIDFDLFIDFNRCKRCCEKSEFDPIRVAAAAAMELDIPRNKNTTTAKLATESAVSVGEVRKSMMASVTINPTVWIKSEMPGRGKL